MNKNIGIVLGIIIILGIGLFVFSGNQKKNEMVNNIPETQNEVSVNEGANDTPVAQSDSQIITQTEEKVMVENEPAIAKKGSYENHSAEKIAMAETGKVVLFFHASWCPSCRALNSDIEKNINIIPAGVTILKTDYDKETELKKKYGVTSQHTLVQVDKDGNLIKKWSGGSKLENLISQIQ